MTERSELPGTPPTGRRWAPVAESGAVRDTGRTGAASFPMAECFPEGAR
ncbi:hypothetical protein [Embleya scabrispora]|nr:hypothetical protein [Embleya scabrispora]